ncbi:hypothetical protein WL76_30755 [Burkholderia ubonensis]|uniref:Uncharacterized protein n=1 Tax=Burkholderia ubonensis TaxID=101571 RepID=A0A119UPR4_9BURK|nr:hypothetical protein WJ35_19830 [Burkholderia ubonensis]KWE44571.1 hypothetical protein WL76_30755 [Burkholderia ubonensis]KWK68216.1 hypothetical protein WM16_01525 [Burkholderia ubonensis]
MNQGKKSVAHRSTPFGTQNRRVLQAAGSTICGAGRRTSRSRKIVARRGSPTRGSATAFPS